MRNIEPMQINLLDFKYAKKRADQHRLKVIIFYSLTVIVILTIFYLLYSQAMIEKTQANVTFEHLQEQQAQLLKGAAISDDSQDIIRQKLLQQAEFKQNSWVPYLNIIFTVAGNEISLAKIIVNGDEIIIEANAQNYECVKIFIEELDSNYFEPIKELKIEKNTGQIEFSLKLNRRL